MIWIDYLIISLIGFSMLVSLVRGLAGEALSLLTWGCAIFVSSHFYSNLALYLTCFKDILIRKSIAIVILFITILIVGAICNYMISILIKKTGLLSINRVFGICFGVARGGLIVTAILYFLDTFTSLSQSADWQHSQLIPQFKYIIKWLFKYLQHSPLTPQFKYIIKWLFKYLQHSPLTMQFIYRLIAA
ncbi:CvpA family protein [Candidatus Gillettellia adelgis]